MNEIIENFKTIITQKYAKFDGRASRKELGYFVLVQFAIAIVFTVLDTIIAQITNFTPLSVLLFIYMLATIVPSIALGFRRVQDLGFPGYAYLAILIPCVGFILLILLLVLPGQPQDNQYGPNPLASSNPPPTPPPPALS